jgi:RNA polymerase sigma factor (sigma-70 family)
VTAPPLPATSTVEGLLRDLAPEVLGALVRRRGDFDECDDAVQEALVDAVRQWPTSGVPANPRGWLIAVADRRWIEARRADAARRRREETATAEAPDDLGSLDPADAPEAGDADDTLMLLLLCAHPSLTLPSQVALTLRAVGGLTTAQIARGFLVPEATIGQRISRAKERIRASGARFELPPPSDLPARVAAVERVLYLVFTEGHTASDGDKLTRVDLTSDAIRLARQLHVALPEDGEAAGLLALLLLTDARRPARTTPDGELVPLAEQDRTLWDHAAIVEGIELISEVLARAPVGPYQLQAAIAALHDEAERYEDTDWSQILVLYEHLELLAPGPMVTLNRIVAEAMVDGAPAALAALAAAVDTDATLRDHPRTDAVRAHLLDLAGERAAARDAYRAAAKRALNVRERRYLERQAAKLEG